MINCEKVTVVGEKQATATATVTLVIIRYVLLLFMVALWNRADHYIWFLLLSFLLLSFFFLFSSPNLRRRRLDVCHTSTHGVALVRI